jgi:hypothetical protein
MSAQAINRTINSTFGGLQSKTAARHRGAGSPEGWTAYNEADIKAALRKAFNAGRRWTEREEIVKDFKPGLSD